MTDHVHTHAAADAAADARTCCSDTPQARERVSRAQRLVAITGAVGLGVAVVGLVLGGWVGAVLVAVIALGIAVTLVGSWTRLSLNDRLMRVAVVVLLVALALVRAIPR